MATKSMLKNVDIKDRKLGRNLVEALEEAITHQRKKINKNITCEEVKKDNIKDLFG